MRTLFAQPDESLATDLTFEQISSALQNPSGLLWLDLDGATSDDYDRLLTETFGFHPLAVDDALNEVHIPKLDDWHTYLYLVLTDAQYDPVQHALVPLELDVFLGENYVVTYHVGASASVDRVWNLCQRTRTWLERGPDHVLYRLIDEMVNAYTGVIDNIEDDVEAIEAQIYSNPDSELLEVLFDLKRTIQHLRRVLAPQRDVVNRLARDDHAVIDARDRIYFRDVYDHLLRLYDLTDSLWDLSIVALDIYLSVVNNRMNDIMKTLTLITTLFMPLGFLTGFFGMNFFQSAVPLEAWTGIPAFVVVLALMAVIPGIMYLWMRQHAWA